MIQVIKAIRGKQFNLFYVLFLIDSNLQEPMHDQFTIQNFAEIGLRAW